jgi:cyanophycinase
MTKSENTCPVPKGILLVIGGAESKGKLPQNHEAPDGYKPLEILKCFTELLRGDEPCVEIITTASGEGAASFRQYKSLFKKSGIQNVGHIQHVTRKEVLDDKDLEI